MSVAGSTDVNSLPCGPWQEPERSRARGRVGERPARPPPAAGARGAGRPPHRALVPHLDNLAVKGDHVARRVKVDAADAEAVLVVLGQEGLVRTEVVQQDVSRARAHCVAQSVPRVAPERRDFGQVRDAIGSRNECRGAQRARLREPEAATAPCTGCALDTAALVELPHDFAADVEAAEAAAYARVPKLDVAVLATQQRQLVVIIDLDDLRAAKRGECAPTPACQGQRVCGCQRWGGGRPAAWHERVR